MTQEDKDLLLKDLCARLPYGIKCHIGDNKPYTLSSVSDDYDGILIRFKEQKNGFNMEVYLSECMPYLFPLSSMTEEQKEELRNLGWNFDNFEIHNINECLGTYREFVTHLDCCILINWLNKNHFDIGLIPKGLAIDCTNLNIY